MKSQGSTYYMDDLIVHVDNTLTGTSVVFLTYSTHALVYDDRWADSAAVKLSSLGNRLRVIGEVHHIADRIVPVERAGSRDLLIRAASNIVPYMGERGALFARDLMCSTSDRQALCVACKYLPEMMNQGQRMVRFTDALNKEFANVTGKTASVRRVRG